jgi:hypothetical protein
LYYTHNRKVLNSSNVVSWSYLQLINSICFSLFCFTFSIIPERYTRRFFYARRFHAGRRFLVAEVGCESVAQVLTALLELMNMVELKGDVRFWIRHQVLTNQINTRLLDHQIGLSEKKLEE